VCGPRVSLDGFREEKKSRASAGIQTPDRPDRSLVTTLNELPWDQITILISQTKIKIFR